MVLQICANTTAVGATSRCHCAPLNGANTVTSAYACLLYRQTLLCSALSVVVRKHLVEWSLTGNAVSHLPSPIWSFGIPDRSTQTIPYLIFHRTRLPPSSEPCSRPLNASDWLLPAPAVRQALPVRQGRLALREGALTIAVASPVPTALCDIPQYHMIQCRGR